MFLINYLAKFFVDVINLYALSIGPRVNTKCHVADQCDLTTNQGTDAFNQSEWTLKPENQMGDIHKMFAEFIAEGANLK